MMATVKAEIRSGMYYDSAVLMQLQRSLAGLAGVQDAGVVMGTESNKELLAHIDLLSPEVQSSKPDDLVIVVRAEDEKTALEAISKVDELLTRRKSGIEQEYKPHSLETAAEMLPNASVTPPVWHARLFAQASMFSSSAIMFPLKRKLLLRLNLRNLACWSWARTAVPR
jgi:hypothetical protein